MRTEGEFHPEFGFLGAEVWCSGLRRFARLRKASSHGMKQSWCEELALLGTFFLGAANVGDAVVEPAMERSLFQRE
ncbi:hypothetical protein ABIA38_005010 [Embleya sp. AB8]